MPPRARGPKTFGAGGGHAKDAKYTLRRLGGYIWEYKYLFILAITISLASNAFALIGPLLSGYAIDALELGKGHVDFPKVFHYATLIIIFYIASALLSYAPQIQPLFETIVAAMNAQEER